MCVGVGCGPPLASAGQLLCGRHKLTLALCTQNESDNPLRGVPASETMGHPQSQDPPSRAHQAEHIYPCERA